MKALETEYKGCRFRSRLEGRWAAFMDAAGVKWEYEKEGYDLDGLFYLPDFWLPKLESFLEIKPSEPNHEETEKASRLAQASGHKVYLFWGTPEVPDFGGFHSEGCAHVYEDSGGDYHHVWCECQICGFVGIEFDGRSERLNCGCDKGKADRYNFDSTKLKAAYAKARSYRFEPSARGCE